MGTQKKGSGWTNLLNHLKSQHPNYSDDASQLKLSTFMPKNKMADTVFGWIEWICTDLLPFTFVEKEMSRKYSNLDNIRQAGIAYNDLRKSLSPVNLEEQMFLKQNRRFWDVKSVIDIV